MREHPAGATRALIFAAFALGCGSGAAAGRDGSAGAGGTRGLAGSSGHDDAGGDHARLDTAIDVGAAVGEPHALADGAAPVSGTPVDTFDTDLDFGLNPTADTVETNLGHPVGDAGAPATLSFDSDEGSPSPGSLKVTVPYSGPNQYVDVQSFVYLVPQDWSGHILHVRLKVDEGSVFHGIAQLYVDTGVSYTPAASAVNVLPGSNWQDLAMDLAHPMTADPSGRFNPKQVVLYGLQLNTGPTDESAGPATFHVDSFSLE